MDNKSKENGSKRTGKYMSIYDLLRIQYVQFQFEFCETLGIQTDKHQQTRERR